MTAATRASSLSADGSGAPSHRGRLTVLALAIAAFALLAFAPLSQAKTAINGFGKAASTGSFGGQFTVPDGVAVNNSGAGAARGTFYVADRSGRVSRFSPSGAWERTWGKDVIATSYNEKQMLTINATGGTFTLTFKGETTDPIPFDASRRAGHRPNRRRAERNLAKLVSLGAIGQGNLFELSGGNDPCTIASDAPSCSRAPWPPPTCPR